MLTEVLGKQFGEIDVTDDLEAMAHKAARTSKTERGAKRRGVIMSVLASLFKRLDGFTLGNFLTEINHWFETGRSVFQEELAGLPLAVVPP